MKPYIKTWHSAVLIGFVLLIPYFYTISYPFYWDTIQLGSKHASFFVDHLDTLFLPTDIDSGHMPIFGYLLGLWWWIFGKSLISSHLFMLPMLLSILFYSYKLSYFLIKEKAIWLWLCLMIEPAFITQTTLVSPDVMLMLGFYILIYGILKKSPIIGLGSLLLISSSNRGFAVFSAILAAQLVYLYFRKEDIMAFVILSFYCLPSVVLYFGYQYFHFQKFGWIGFHPSMEWAPSFEKVGGLGMLKNTLIMAWRFVDTGRIITMLLCLLILFGLLKSNKKSESLIIPFKYYLLSLILVLAILTVPYAYLTGHRYYMPIYHVSIILVVSILVGSLECSKSRLVLVGIIISSLGGHFLIYPRGIAMGWDTTLAYIPYQKLRIEMIDYLNREDIAWDKVGSGFPNLSSRKYIDLEINDDRFSPFDLKSNEYVLYSNVFNEMEVKDHETLQLEWKKVKSMSSGAVEMILYKRTKK